MDPDPLDQGAAAPAATARRTTGWRDPGAARHRRRRRGVTVAVGVVLAAGGIGGGLAASAGTGLAGLRLGHATRASVQRLMEVEGILQPVDRVNLVFGVHGVVATVDVSVGDTVSAGQTLATLAPTSLTTAVDTAQRKLADAQLALHQDEVAQAEKATTGSPATHITTPPGGSGGTGGPTPTAVLAADQQALVTAQAAVSADTQTATAALITAESVCGTTASATGAATTTAPAATPTGPTGPTDSHAATSPAAGATAPSSSAQHPAAAIDTPSAAPPAPGTECAQALAASLAGQKALARSEAALTQAEAALATLLESGVLTVSTGGPATATTRTADIGPMVTAAQIDQDEADVATAQALLTEAQEALSQAALTTPVAGTVGAIRLAPGETVGPTVTTGVITVLSANAFEATATLTSSQVPAVKVGERARVSVFGATGKIEATVSRVGPVVPDQGDVYPLVVALPPAAGITTGTLARISVITKVATRVLVVPTSAVHDASGRAPWVLGVEHGSPQRRPVSVGIVSGRYTQITKGLRPGTAVVLSVLTQPLPTPSTTKPRTNGGPRPIPLTQFGGGYAQVTGSAFGR